LGAAVAYTRAPKSQIRYGHLFPRHISRRFTGSCLFEATAPGSVTMTTYKVAQIRVHNNLPTRH